MSSNIEGYTLICKNYKQTMNTLIWMWFRVVNLCVLWVSYWPLRYTCVQVRVLPLVVDLKVFPILEYTVNIKHCQYVMIFLWIILCVYVVNFSCNEQIDCWGSRNVSLPCSSYWRVACTFYKGKVWSYFSFLDSFVLFHC